MPRIREIGQSVRDYDDRRYISNCDALDTRGFAYEFQVLAEYVSLADYLTRLRAGRGNYSLLRLPFVSQTFLSSLF